MGGQPLPNPAFFVLLLGPLGAFLVYALLGKGRKVWLSDLGLRLKRRLRAVLKRYFA